MMNIKKTSVLLISVDALKPEFLLNQLNFDLKIPNLIHYFVDNGIYAANGVKSVFPTFTYPCHQSMITGVNPSVHGIANNILFDPTGTHNSAWYWFVNKKVETLWEAAKVNGYVSASVAFPTSVGAKGDYIAPEFWWDGSDLDSTFIDAVANPQGLIAEMEQDIGRYPSGLDLTEKGDVQRYKAAAWLLENKLNVKQNGKPYFLSAYFGSFDETAHIHGVYSKEAAQSLEKIDAMIGDLIETAIKVSCGDLVVCVVSDHGSLNNCYNISPNVLFAKENLITLDKNNKVVDWKVWSQRAGGTSEIRIKDAQDANTREKVEEILLMLLEDKSNGILEVLDHEQCIQRGGFPQADYVLVSQKGYEIRDNVSGPYCTDQLSQKAQHGYSEEFEEMKASFMLWGKGIERGKNIGGMHLIDVAPSLAKIMGFEMQQAQGRAVL